MNPDTPDFTDALLFAERPQIAAVAALESALAVTIAIFLAAYPNLSDQDPEWISDRYAEDAYADAIIQQGMALEHSLRAYRTALERDLRIRLSEKRSSDCSF